jgi:hypothetical protein
VGSEGTLGITLPVISIGWSITVAISVSVGKLLYWQQVRADAAVATTARAWAEESNAGALADEVTAERRRNDVRNDDGVDSNGEFCDDDETDDEVEHDDERSFHGADDDDRDDDEEDGFEDEDADEEDEDNERNEIALRARSASRIRGEVDRDIQSSRPAFDALKYWVLGAPPPGV